MLLGPDLRTKVTEAEILLWRRLRSNRIGVKFRRQVDIGSYVVDFCCFPEKLIIELDGEVHKRSDRRRIGIGRTKCFEKLGYRVIRFWNDEVVNNIDTVLERIRGSLTPRSSGASLSVDTERGTG